MLANTTPKKVTSPRFTGVYYSIYTQRYEVKIGYKGRRILLGSSEDDPVRLAAMYNVAARYLYGELAGQLNSVPELNHHDIAKVERLCRRYCQQRNRQGKNHRSV